MSLRARLILSIAASVLLTFVVGGMIVYLHAVQKVDIEMRAALAVGERIIANSLDTAPSMSDARRRLDLILADFDSDRHLRAYLTDPDGRILAESRAAAPVHAAPRWFTWLVAGEPRSVAVTLPSDLAGFGKLHLAADPRNEAGEAWDDTLKTLAVLSILTGVLALSAYGLLGAALKPLEEMAAAFARAGSEPGDVQLPPDGPPEYVRVSQAFNQMIARKTEAETTSRRLTEQLLTVQEEERADIARDLHDEIGPFLFAVDVDTAAVKRMVEEGDLTLVPARLSGIREAVGHMQRHVKDILARLRPAALLDLGLADALDHLVQSWQARHSGIRFRVETQLLALPADVERIVYRIVQEALSNAVRHGSPRHVDVIIQTASEWVRIEICDDGAGLPDAREGRGFGLAGMRERAATLGGKVVVADREDGPGVRVVAKLPLQRPDLPIVTHVSRSTEPA